MRSASDTGCQQSLLYIFSRKVTAGNGQWSGVLHAMGGLPYLQSRLPNLHLRCGALSRCFVTVNLDSYALSHGSRS